MGIKMKVLLAASNSGDSNTLSLYKASIAMETFAKMVLLQYCKDIQGYGGTVEDVNDVYKSIEKEFNK